MIEIKKELKDIALDITEPEYRAMPELSYSTLSTYETLGFTGLEHLFDKKESPSLTLGSCVDAILTGGEEEFNKQFLVADIPSLGDKEKQVADCLVRELGKECPNILYVQPVYILAAADKFEFQKNWREDTRVKVLSERIGEYYKVKASAEDKTIISLETFQKVQAMVRALRESPATRNYFAEDTEDSPIRRYYQLKFKFYHNNVGYRSMMDLVLVDYENKIIYPVDLKTSMGCTEWDFEKNFMQWHYFIQARLYWRNLRANMDNDPYFKDFSLENYRFIIVNSKTLTPLVWEFPLTKESGTLIDDKGNEIKDPFEIGEELRFYLDNHPKVPRGINPEGTNVIKCLRKK